MSVLTENIVLSRTRSQDLRAVRKLNLWGNDLKDVSIVRRLPNVEVLSLSVNHITTLSDFESCKCLQELYLRKNRIANINEVLYLTDLPDLKKLGLEENPCAEFDNYRMTVLKALPNLECLDNVKVTPDEVMRAERDGNDLYLHNDDDDDRDDNYDNNMHGMGSGNATQMETHNSTVNTAAVIPQAQSYTPENALSNYAHSNPSSTASHYQSAASSPRTELQSTPVVPQPRTHMVKSNSISDYNLFNGNNMTIGHPTQSPGVVHYDPMFQYGCSDVSVAASGFHQSPPINASRGNLSSAQSVTSTQSQSSVRLLPKGGRNRNANILSAVLCLIKELDYASLEVVDTTIHCRMEEMED